MIWFRHLDRNHNEIDGAYFNYEEWAQAFGDPDDGLDDDTPDPDDDDHEEFSIEPQDFSSWHTHQEINYEINLQYSPVATDTFVLVISDDQYNPMWQDTTSSDPGFVRTESESGIPAKTALLSAYPNPFNNAVTLPFTLKSPGTLRLVIYNIEGQVVYRRRYTTPLQAGRHQLKWQGVTQRNMPVASGEYIVQFRTKNVVNSQKILLIK